MRLLLGALVLATVVPSAPPASPAKPPAVEPYRLDLPTAGYIDWYRGTVGGIGRVRIFRDIDHNKGYYELTKSEAGTKARDLALQALEGMSIDGAARVKDREDVMVWARKRLGDAAPVSAGRSLGSFFDAVMELPLRGEGGALAMLLPATNRLSTGDHLQRTSDAPPQAAPAVPPGLTGLMIDARSLPAEAVPEPALLPRIIDAGGRVVYDTDRVDLDFAREYGLLSYAVDAPAGSRPNESMKPPRTGDRPLLVDAAAAAGGVKTDIVVSVDDADRILAAASAGTFLQECRVVVLMPPPRIKPEQVVPRRYMRPHATPSPANPNEPGRKE